MYPRRSEEQGISMGERLRSLVILIRPVNSFMMAFAVLVGLILAEGGWPRMGLDRVAAGMAAGFLLLGSAMVFNDYADADIDRINMPERPIPRGVISLKTALMYAVALGVLGLVAAAYTGITTFLLALAAWVISILYDFQGKNTGLPGNFMVSFNVAMPIAYGAALASKYDESLLVFWLMIFLSNTGREIIKGIADVPGDMNRGVRTLAITKGEGAAALAAAGFTLAAVAFSPIPYVLGQASHCYLVVAIADAGFLHASYSILRDQSMNNARRVKNEMLLCMLLGLISFLLARIPCI